MITIDVRYQVAAGKGLKTRVLNGSTNDLEDAQVTITNLLACEEVTGIQVTYTKD